MKEKIKAQSLVKATTAFELYKQGKTYDQIALELNVTRGTISRYIHSILNQLAKANSTDIALLRAELKERYLYIAAESIKAWEESKEYTTKKKKKALKTGGKDGGGSEVSEEVEIGHGDPKFLTLAKETVDSLSELFGAAPKETSDKSTGISITSAGTGEVTIKTTWGVAPAPKKVEPIETTAVKQLEYDDETD